MPNAASRPLNSFVLGAVLVLVARGATAAPDAKLLAAANAAQPAVVETLKTLVSIESGSRDVEGLATMAARLDERLQALGFKTERRAASPGAGAAIVIGTLAGTGNRRASPTTRAASR
jgi:glutamate carboxypeptidase